MEEEKKYYFPATGIMQDNCTELCQVKNNGVMIGSVICQECEFCKGTGGYHPDYPEWIICSKIKEASNNA